MSTRTFNRLDAKRREQTPLALARLVVIGLFISLWTVFWIARMPMPRPFLAVLAIEAVFFVVFWRTVYVLPTVVAVERANRVMLAAEIIFHTTIVYFLGGISWFGVFAYVFGLIFTNTFLDLRRGFIYTSGATLAFGALVALEATGTIPHYVYLEQDALRHTDPRFVITTAVGAGGVFFSIYLWVNWVGHQLRVERDGAVTAQDQLIQARSALERANEELELRVGERTVELEQANAALERSAQQLRTVIANAPVVLFALDPEGAFTLAEGKGLDSMGAQQSRVVGHSAFEILQNSPAAIDSVRRALEGESFTATVEVARRNLEVHYTPVFDDTDKLSTVIGVAIDVTEYKEAEEQIRLLQTITQAIGDTQDFTSALTVALTSVCRSAKWDYGEAWIPNADRTVLECGPAWYGGRQFDRFREASAGLTFEQNAGLPGLVWSLRRPLWLADVVRERAFVRAEIASDVGLQAGLGVPIIADGQVIAVLVFFMTQAREEDTKTVDVVSAVATQLGSAIQRKRTEEALRESETKFRTLAETMRAAVFILQGEKMRYVNAAAEMLSGFTREELLTMSFWDAVHPEFQEAARERGLARQRGERLPPEHEVKIVTKTGEERWVEFRVSTIMFEEEPAIMGAAFDVTQRKRTEEALRESESKFRIMAKTVAAAVFIFQGDHLHYVNPTAEEMTGYTHDELLTMRFWDVIHPEFRDLVQRRGQFLQRGDRVPARYEVKVVTKSGEERWVDFTAGLIDYEGKPAVLGTAFDISKRKRAEEALREAADHDPLTGLLNRRAGFAALADHLETAKRSGGRFATFVLDLDRFKSINDSFSHETGDAALVKFAGVMTDLVGDQGVVCRVGGDEFEIGMSGFDLARALAFVEELQASLRESLGESDWKHRPQFKVSAGVACYPEDGKDVATLGRRADQAMYAAKAAGGDGARTWRDVHSEAA